MAERRFIDANNLIEEIREERCYNCRNFKDMKCDYCGTADYIYMIEDMPAADVVPVRHGRWDDEHKCTVCHNEAFFKISDIRPDYDYDWEENLVETGNYIWDTEWIETAYCPSCGAKMDGDMNE